MTKKHVKYRKKSPGEMYKVPTGKFKKSIIDTNTGEALKDMSQQNITMFQNNLPSHLKIIEVPIYKRVPIPGKERYHRILTPEESDDLVMELNLPYQYLYNATLYSGCRYKEIRKQLIPNPSLFYDCDKEFIIIANKKPKAQEKEGMTREVLLHKPGQEAVDSLLKYHRKHPFHVPESSELVAMMRRAAKKANLAAIRGYRYVCEDGTNDWKEKKSKLIDEGMTPVQAKNRLLGDKVINHQVQTYVDNGTPFKECPKCHSKNFRRLDEWWDVSINSHMLRRTWENWLMVSFPKNYETIIQSMGHDMNTAKQHYIGGAMRTNLNVMADIKIKTKNWGGLNGK